MPWAECAESVGSGEWMVASEELGRTLCGDQVALALIQVDGLFDEGSRLIVATGAGRDLGEADVQECL